MNSNILIIVLILLMTLVANKEHFWYSSKVATADGDDCIIQNGIMVCREKGIFPSFFYPSYYYQPYPYYSSYYRHGGRHGRRGGRRRRGFLRHNG